METKKRTDKSKKAEKVESIPVEKKKLSPLGEWLNDPNRVPLIEIIDMRAVLR